MFGGVPLWLGFITVAVLFLPHSNRPAWVLIGLSSLMFGLGFVDDVMHLSPRAKFLMQLLAAALAVSGGMVYPFRGSLVVNIAISILWIVGITNAFNLLDNMDGLSAGIALIVSLYLTAFYVASGSSDYAIMVAGAGGALAGFLIFNFNPARIFMGDSGSLFIGFFLASASLLQVTHVSGVPTFVFAPLAVLAVPIFDTFFVSITRRLRGQPASMGGTDHSSHRLVNLGLSERNAVLLLYGLAMGSGAVALVARNLPYPHAMELLVFWYLLLLLFGIHLFRGDPTSAHEEHFQSRFLSRLLALDTLAFLIDPLVISFSYCFAYFLRFRAAVPEGEFVLFFRSWPVVLVAKFTALYFFNTYGHSWWRGSKGDAYRIARAVVAGEIAAVILLTGIYRFNGYSRLLFVVDGVVSWMLLFGVRKSLFLFRESVRIFGAERPTHHSVFILGTSERAELALRFLTVRRIHCAGLIDTNGGRDVNRNVWGTRVVGRLDDLVELALRYRVSQVVLPDDEPLPCSEAELHDRYRNDSVVQLVKLGLYSSPMRNRMRGDPVN